MTDTITHRGEKAVIDDEGNVSGWLAPFGGPFGGKDLDGEFFAAKTDFGLDYYATIPVLFAHGHDPEVGAAKVGEITIKEIRDKGVWVEGHLDRQSSYYDAIRELAGKGDMYWSSGAISHLVKRNAKTGEIKAWPIAEATLTLTPANPMAEASVKSADEPTDEATAEPPKTAEHADFGGRSAVLITFTEPAAKAAAQSLHDHAISLGATCSHGDAGEAKEAPPADVLAPAGDDVEPASDIDLASLKSLLGPFVTAAVTAELKGYFKG